MKYLRPMASGTKWVEEHVVLQLREVHVAPALRVPDDGLVAHGTVAWPTNSTTCQ